MGAYYYKTIAQFLGDDASTITGILTTSAGSAGFFDQIHTQTLSWIEQIEALKISFIELCKSYPSCMSWSILLEYPIARRKKRIDLVILANNLVYVVEYKSGKNQHASADKMQVLDYCLDLRDFHSQSRNKIIIPVLWATNAKSQRRNLVDNHRQVKEVVETSTADITFDIIESFKLWGDKSCFANAEAWNESDYNPTPTIIEAAQTLFAGQSVDEITQSHADKVNLNETSKVVIDAISWAKNNQRKAICFITGVPGAGKTLAGLNIAHDPSLQFNDKSLATFLSGNAPLIKVLKKALSKDAFKKINKIDKSAKQKETDRIISFIENAHGFLDEYFNQPDKIPNNKVIIFDEAQRAWDANQSLKKFKRNFSEAEMMFEIMDRHPDWAVIVALIGGGQEINKGEAGLPEWGRSIEQRFSDWKVFISPQLKSGNHSTGNLTLFKNIPKGIELTENAKLHLTVAIRSYKAEHLSSWVSLVLENKPTEALQVFNNHLQDYPVVITRNLDVAKNWLRTNCKGSRRMGLVATSGARRLLPYGFDVRMPLEEAEWFLNDSKDIRSSSFLELAATEYRIQGLELGWVGLCWDLDLSRENGGWFFRTFSGTKWDKVKNVERQRFFLNKYRVLLTRAREGMVIFVPPGEQSDNTRKPHEYDAIANYLISCGAKELF